LMTPIEGQGDRIWRNSRRFLTSVIPAKQAV
jgi:hypothetical protein